MNPLTSLRSEIADRVQVEIRESLAAVNQTTGLIQGRVIRTSEAIELAALAVTLAAVIIGVSVIIRNLTRPAAP